MGCVFLGLLEADELIRSFTHEPEGRQVVREIRIRLLPLAVLALEPFADLHRVPRESPAAFRGVAGHDLRVMSRFRPFPEIPAIS